MRRRIEGNYRTKTAFLFWPKTLPMDNNITRAEREIRWLERTSWVQFFVSPLRGSSGFWRDEHWSSE